MAEQAMVFKKARAKHAARQDAERAGKPESEWPPWVKNEKSGHKMNQAMFKLVQDQPRV